MSFTLCNALQIFKLTYEAHYSVDVERAFSACELFATTHNRCVVFETICQRSECYCLVSSDMQHCV